MMNQAEMLPEQFKTNLEVLHIVHCDATLWAATLGLSTTIPGLWHKIRQVVPLCGPCFVCFGMLNM
eukprot:1145683-Pelagomonas_calceolata.AAC.2